MINKKAAWPIYISDAPCCDAFSVFVRRSAPTFAPCESFALRRQDPRRPQSRYDLSGGLIHSSEVFLNNSLFLTPRYEVNRLLALTEKIANG